MWEHQTYRRERTVVVQVLKAAGLLLQGVAVYPMDDGFWRLNPATPDGTNSATRVDGPLYWINDAVIISIVGDHTERRRAQGTSGLPTSFSRLRNGTTYGHENDPPRPPKLPVSGITAAAVKTLNALSMSNEELPEQIASPKRHQ